MNDTSLGSCVFRAAPWASLLVLVLASACGSPAMTPRDPAQHLDPTPLARCQVGGGAQNPLVTEWSASEKARLESLLGSQTVFVRFTGCELVLVDACRQAGVYGWTRTTLSTDTVEIRSEDELYAKLPIGAARLQGELRSSGRLAVQTRVAGQLRLESNANQAPKSEACRSATHVVSAVSLGAFKLMRGESSSFGGEFGAGDVGLGGKNTETAQVLREAGSDVACANTGAEAAHPACASPLQLFLTPLAPGDSEPPAHLGPDAVRITFPAHEGERWALYDAKRDRLCDVPCRAWIPRKSGYILRNEDLRSVKIPDDLPFAGGQHAVAEYHPQRGSPKASTWVFWTAGVSATAPGITLLVLGLDRAFAEPPQCDVNTDISCRDEREHAAFFIAGGSVFLGLFGASLYYYLISEDERFSLQAPRSASGRRPSNATVVRIGPGFVAGTF
jgi:hypothetical protein